LVQAVESGGNFSATVCAHEHFEAKHLLHHPVGFASPVWRVGGIPFCCTLLRGRLV
jgi:hypothetical protein